MLAYFVYFRVQHADQPTLLDYADFMRRARWKAYSLPQRLQSVGNYLSVFFPPSVPRYPREEGSRMPSNQRISVANDGL